jgi:folate-binding protein YgfZ
MSVRTPFYDLSSQAGAIFREEAGWLVPAHYGDAAAEHHQARAGAVFFDISHHGTVEVKGPEADRFLHNLCTNDILRLAPGTGCEAFFTNAKARVIAPVLVQLISAAGKDKVFWIGTGPGLGQKVLQHLDHHLISEQVELGELTGAFAQLHVAGPAAADTLRAALEIDLPDLQTLQSAQRTSGGEPVPICRHEPLALPGYDLRCPPGKAEDIWHRLLTAGARPAGLDAYGILRVEAGTPVFGRDIDDNRLVMEVGRTAQAICYTKGCYLGQEPIVMARDRGHVNRTLLGLKIQGAEPAIPGARVFQSSTEVGQVTSSVVSPLLGPIALAYLRRGSQEPGTTVEVEASAGSTRLTALVASLPFSGAGLGAGPKK